jgi:hypothetical protein
MEFEKKGKLKVELRTFFSLTILNVVVAALTLALGISLSVTPLLDMIDIGKFDPFSIILIGLGIAAIAGGFYWLMEIVEIMDGIDEIKTAYDELGEDEKDAVTSLIVRMMAYYHLENDHARKNWRGPVPYRWGGRNDQRRDIDRILGLHIREHRTTVWSYHRLRRRHRGAPHFSILLHLFHDLGCKA